MFHDPRQEIMEAALGELDADQVKAMKRRIEGMADAIEAADPDGEQSELYGRAVQVMHDLQRIANMLSAGNPWDSFAAFKETVKG